MAYKANPRDFVHEDDQKALDALKSIPGFDQLIKGFMKIYSERTMKILNMSSKVRLSQEQCPQIYELLPPVCEAFGIEVPELYLESNREPNAYTSGDTYVFITITTGLLELFSEEEVQAVLAHECGHILCHHVLYQTMGRFIMNGAAQMLGLGGLVSTALRTAFAYWLRCSEFSADRASAVFCGGPERVIDVMLRMAGGSRKIASEINADLFMQQADEYADYVSDSAWNRILESLVLMNSTHPFLSVRASGIRQWCRTDRFRQIVSGMTGTETKGDGRHCGRCGAPVKPEWSFCRKCGSPLSF